MVCVMAAWLGAAHAQEPDYIIQSNSAPLIPIGVAPPTASAVHVPAPPAPASAPVAPSAPSAPVAVQASAPAQPPETMQPVVHKIRIGLLLPTSSPSLGDAAQVVRAGFEAAAATDGTAEVVNVDEQESNVVQRYRTTVASGVKVMVGPLTRQGIASIVPYVSVPTLALNAVEPGLPAKSKLLSLSLTVEGEARQMARMMHDDGRTSPLVVSAGDVLSQRLTQAFSQEWQKQTGSAPVVLAWPATTPLADAVKSADSVFVAMSADDAAALKPTLPDALTVYATSQLNTRNPVPALAGIRFIDMPWFLMPDQTEVKHYPRPASPLTVQTERLYALGIDAYRIALMMSNGKWSVANMHLHGVTGDLKLAHDRQFERTLPLAVMMPAAAQ